MNNQELFNKAYVGLAKQGFKKCTLNGACLYRGPGGMKCGIGQAIPDELYEPDMEMEYTLLDVLKVIGFDGDHQIAKEIQAEHDCALAPDQMKEDFWHIAKRYGLKVPAIEGVEYHGTKIRTA